MLNSLFALALIVTIAGAMRALAEYLFIRDPEEWRLDDVLFPVTTLNGDRASGYVMVRYLDGRKQYRKPTEKELADFLADDVL